MSRMIGVLYASRESHTQHIAEHIGATLRTTGFEAEILNVHHQENTNLKGYSAVILAASVHSGKHEPEMIEFVKLHRRQLLAIPSVFLSVSLSEAGVERSAPETEEQNRFLADVQNIEDGFIAATDWPPDRFKAVAGALPYSKYNFFVRFVMKRISQKSGGDTDTSKDYDYTNWIALDKFVSSFAESAMLTA